ncbi:hypothetical protein AB0F09_06540 [Streptomyces olivaceus]|uniref:hypothetical protein n=1 Tax=Streptomyces olivaceus TaxID=47716 RepID=UPI0033C3392E
MISVVPFAVAFFAVLAAGQISDRTGLRRTVLGSGFVLAAVGLTAAALASPVPAVVMLSVAPTLLGQVESRTGSVDNALLIVAVICLVALAGCALMRYQAGARDTERHADPTGTGAGTGSEPDLPAAGPGRAVGNSG